jgi:peroxin-5
MADCGATGSALDRAARSLLQGGGGSGSGNTIFSNLLSHAAGTVLLPAVSPEQRNPIAAAAAAAASPPALRQQYSSALDVAQAHQARHGAATLPHHNINATKDVPLLYHPHHGIQSPPNMMMSAAPQYIMLSVQHQQQQQQQMSMMRHQEAMWMQQQQQQQHVQYAMMIQQQQQQQRIMLQHQQPKSQQTILATSAEAASRAPVAVVTHEGLVQPAGIEVLAEAWKGAQQQQQHNQHDVEEDTGHQGIVHPAGIDELAAAWAEAEAEYHQSLQDEEQAGILDYTDYDAEESTYQFAHKDEQLAQEDVQDPNKDWMEEGVRHFNAGNVSEAIRAFEMELLHTNENHSGAWRMLGRCHAENDMDREAIQCLEQAVDRDPYSTEALLALGVSYVNELKYERALENLKAWITHNPKFASLEVGEDLYGGEEVGGHGGNRAEAAFDEVQRLLLRALEHQQHSAGNAAEDGSSSSAADILEALGVVYNVSRDYDAAVDAFEKACQLRSNDYQLWNKLGATLANSNKSDQALLQYSKALQIKPRYARAWLNKAISHSNLEQYHDAARCYLQTLSLNPSATHCWSYLRIALSCAEQWDLIPAAAAQDLDAFRDHFDFTEYNT